MKITPSQILPSGRTPEMQPRSRELETSGARDASPVGNPVSDRVEVSPEALAAAHAARETGALAPASGGVVERVADANREAARTRPDDVARLLRLLP